MQVFSQKSKKLSIELGSNSIISTTNFDNTIKGSVTFSFKYRFLSWKINNFGISFSDDFLSEHILYVTNGYDIKDKKNVFSTIHFSAFDEIDLKNVKGFHPIVGFGYSALKYYTSPTKKELSNGYNFGVGVVKDFTNTIFLSAYFQMQQNKFKLPEDIERKYVISQLKICLGARF